MFSQFPGSAAIRCAAFASVLIVSTATSAQALMDITMVPGQNNDLEVRVRPTEAFGEVFAALSFTVRWSDASGATLGADQQTVDQMDVNNVSKSGPEVLDGAYRYQIYAGFSFTNLQADLGVTLTGGEEFVLCTIPVLNANDAFMIVNDAWTQANNGNFFVSLNGYDRTGIIYDMSTGVEQGIPAEGALSVWPSPVLDIAQVAVDMGDAADLHLELFDATGRIVWNGRPSPVGITPVDMRDLKSGAYLLRLNNGQEVRAVHIVKK